MPTALLTGTRPNLGAAAATLGRAGFDVLTWPVGSPAVPADGPFDCYVQLPCAAGEGSDALICRIDTLAAVADRLGPNASILLAVDEPEPPAAPRPGTLAPDLLAAVALALLEDIGRPATRLAVVPVTSLCRPAAEPAPLDSLVGAGQWEMPTPPLVSAP